MENRSVSATDTEAEIYQFRYTAGIIGTSLSCMGYCLMLLTASIFPAWRGARQNQLWLHMCGSYLLYFSVDFYTFLYPVVDTFASAIVEHVKRYIVRVSLLWMMAGAWLTYKNLVDVFSDVGDKFMLKASLILWLGPIPFVGLMYAIYAVQYTRDNYATGVIVKIGCNVFAENESRNLTWFLTCCLDNSFSVVPITGSLVLYMSIAYSLCTQRKTVGHERDFASTVALGFFFVFTCCLQCLIITAKFVFSLGGIWTYVTIILMSFHVSTYATLFIICNKMTRNMWLEFFRSKMVFRSSGLSKT